MIVAETKAALDRVLVLYDVSGAHCILMHTLDPAWSWVEKTHA